MLEERLLQVAVAEPARRAGGASKSAATSGGARSFSSWMQMFLLGVGLRLRRRPAVHHDRHDLLPEGLLVAEDLERVAVALAHLLPVEAGDDRDLAPDHRLRHDEGLAVGLVELDRDVAGHLQVLLLVLADGHGVRVVEEDVGRHQHRIGEQAEIRGDALGDLVLVAVGALEEPHRRQAPDEPGELAHLGHVALAPEDALLRVEAAGEPVDRDRRGCWPAAPSGR